MTIGNDIARCGGDDCPSRNNCRRYTERGATGNTWYAAFWARREAGATACDSIIPVKLMTTFTPEG